MNNTPRPATPASNVHNAGSKVVHAGRWVRHVNPNLGWIEARACSMSNDLNYAFPTDQPVTCKRCASKAVTA